MRTTEIIRPRGEGCTITIEVTPGAAKSELAGTNRWRGSLQVRIAAEPREGAANDELTRFLSEKLGYTRFGYEKSLVKFLDEFFWLRFGDNLPVPPRWIPDVAAE